MPLTSSVVIDSYNYGRYVSETVDSVLAQTLPPDEIIVVDDGSTDDSQEILRQRYGKDPLVTLITQTNGGQGMAVTTGLARARGDLVFFLNSDDQYTPQHLEKVTRVYNEHKNIDYVITAYRNIGANNDIVQQYPCDKNLGFSVIGTMMGQLYVGGMTSMLSLRRRLALTLLPAMQQMAPRWTVGADDLLNYGSSLAGARKYFLAEPTVLYRVHDSNHTTFMLNEWADDKWLRRNNAIAVYGDHLGLRLELGCRADVEFRSIEDPSLAQYQIYRSIIWKLKLSLVERLKMQLRLYFWFKGSKKPTLRSLVGWDRRTS